MQSEQKNTAVLNNSVNLVWQKLQSWVDGFYLLLPNLLAGVTLLVIIVLIAYAVKRTIKTYLSRKNRIDLSAFLSDIVFWSVSTLGLVVALTIIIPSIRIGDLISGLGLGSLAIGFAFKDILQNWMSGLLILLRLPFRRGDQIKVGDTEGTVLRIEPRATVIRTYGGKDVVIPNTQIYSNEVTVQTSQDKRRIEINVTVGYDYDVNFIRAVIEKALSPIEEILDSPAPQVLCWDLGATSLGLKIRWWIKSEQSAEVISRALAIQAIKEAFQAHDIDPTDPSLVYTINSGGQKQNEQTSKPAKTKAKQVAEPITRPPSFEMGVDDPETYTVKAEPKQATLLSKDDA